MIKLLSLILLCSLALAAQEPKPKTPANYTEDNRSAVKLPPPTIPAEHSAEYFAAAAAFARIEPLYQAAQKALEAARVKVIADCGPNAMPNEGAAGKMVCEPKPDAAKPAPAK